MDRQSKISVRGLTMDAMELTDFSRGSYKSSRGGQGRPSDGEELGCCGYRMIQLRKYSLPICLAQALLILVVVSYLVLEGYNNSESSGSEQIPQTEALLTLPKWARQEAQLNRWMSGRSASCNQRVHDYRFGVSCRSNGTCRPVASAFDKPTVGQSDRLLRVVTSKSGDRLEANEISIKRVECSNRSDCLPFGTKMRIHRDRPRQEIIGWGGALSDSSINNLLALSTNATRRLLDDYFAEDGLRYNMIRVTIGGSDFSSRFYTNNDLAPGETDFKLNNFTLKEEDLLYKIPVLRFILKNYNNYNDRTIRLFASMWSPPTWMKDNGHFNKGRLIGGSSGPIFAGGGHESSSKSKRSIGGAYYETLASLKLKFLHQYHEHGVDFWGLTVMNEPIFAVQPFLDFNTMIFPIDDYTVYVSNYLGPRLKGDPLLKSIKLLAHDDNRRFLMNYTSNLLKKEEARKYIDGISTHGYIDQDYRFMQELYDLYAEPVPSPSSFFILPTELCSGHLPFMEKALIGNWHRGVHYGLDIIRGLQHSAAGWVDWNMVLDTQGGPGWLGSRLDSPVIVDKAEDVYYRSPMYYVIGQFSRYIPPGSRRLESTISNDKYDSQFETVAFARPDKRLVVVCLNNNPYQIDINVSSGSNDHGAGSTPDIETFLVLTCPSDSVATFIIEPKSFEIS